MSCAFSWPLQQALFDAIRADPSCAAHLGERVHDAAPPFGTDAGVEGLYLTLGDEAVSDWSTASDHGARHRVTLVVHAPRRGFAEAKQAAAAVAEVVLEGALPLSRGRVVNRRFVSARTRRAELDALREVELRFDITIEDSAG